MALQVQRLARKAGFVMDLESLHRRLTDAEVDATLSGNLGRALRIMALRMWVTARMLKQHAIRLEAANDR